MPYQLSSLTPNLIVADVERSLAFYRDILGFTVEQPPAPGTLALVDVPRIRAAGAR